MALIKIFLFLLVVFHAECKEQMVTQNVVHVPAESLLQPNKIDCGAACNVRCQLSSRPHLCKRACGTCCGRCGCVPPGTYGHYEMCPCYGNLTTRGGEHKCP